MKFRTEARTTTVKISHVTAIGGLDTRVKKIGSDHGAPEDGWYKLVLNISFITFTAR